MTVFQIECFLSLSKSLNFTQSSEELFISQPTLSRNIAALESELGVQLLLRSTKAVELTAAGKRFAKSCLSIMDEYHSAVEGAKQARDGICGQLSLGIQQDAFEPLAVDLVRLFVEKHPLIDLKLIPKPGSQLIKELNEGSLDLIIGAGECALKNPGKLLLSCRPECAVLPVGHPLAERSSLKMAELRGESFVAMSPTASASGYNLIHKYSNIAGFSPNIVARANGVPALMMLVACGVGISILYRDLTPNAYGRLSFVPLEDTEPFQRWLMWDKDSRNPALKHFISCAEEYKEG